MERRSTWRKVPPTADENPEVVLPGFMASLGIISMLGAALLVRKNE